MTPVLAMLHALADTAPTRPVWWLHGARDGTEHPFAAEARHLLARLPRSHTRICYSRPRPQDRQGTHYTDHGQLDPELVAASACPPTPTPTSAARRPSWPT
ncbi:hypothetical protein ACFQ1I_43960 [Kitasatospora arboriphila]